MQRKATADKQSSLKSRNPPRMSEHSSSPTEYPFDDSLPYNDQQSQKPKRLKRPKKSVNENLEPAFTPAPNIPPEQTQFQPIHEFGSSDPST